MTADEIPTARATSTGSADSAPGGPASLPAPRVWLGLVLVVVIGVVSATAFRASLDARRAAQRASEARARGDRVGEIVELGRVIRALPLDRSRPEEAAAALAAIAASAESDADPELAREAWRELRSAWFAVRGLGDPGRSWIDRAAGELTRLGAAREASIEPRLARPLPSLVAALALFGWGGCAFGLVWRGLEPSGRLKRAALPWALGVLAWLSVWVMALRAA